MGTGDLLGQIIFPAARQAGKSPKALEGEKSNIERKMEGTSFGSLESPLDQSRFDHAAAAAAEEEEEEEEENGNGQSQATTMPMTAARNARPSSLSKLKMKMKVDFKSVVKFVSVGGWSRDLCLLPMSGLSLYMYMCNVLHLISPSSNPPSP
jgi:hypothetical protein